jgi:hypothetical protein
MMLFVDLSNLLSTVIAIHRGVPPLIGDSYLQLARIAKSVRTRSTALFAPLKNGSTHPAVIMSPVCPFSLQYDTGIKKGVDGDR